MKLRVWFALGICLFAAWAGSAQMAPTQQQLETRLKSQFLMLRGMYGGRFLAFDSRGNPSMSAQTLPLSLSAVIVDKIRLTTTELRIRGRRAGLAFEMKGPPSSPYNLTGIEWPGNSAVDIVIARDSHHPKDLDDAMARVFSVGIDDALANGAPECWRNWMRHRLHHELPENPLPPGVYGEGGFGAIATQDEIRPPRLEVASQPAYPEIARRLKYRGTIVIGAVVDTSGVPQDVHILRPVGMGLDESAAEAVSRYHFAPATRSGAKVPAEVDVEVTIPSE